MTEITIYTDGSCQTQTRIGDWAAVLSCGEYRKALSGSAAEDRQRDGTDGGGERAENALKGANQTVTLITDSQYVARGVNEWMPGWIERGWLTTNKKPVANRELWEQLHGLLTAHQVTVTDPRRAERVWLVLSIALLKLTAVGEVVALLPQWQALRAQGKQSRRLSAPVLGWIDRIVSLFTGDSVPIGDFQLYPWQTEPKPQKTYP